MKKNIITSILLILLFSACDDMNDIHQDYLDWGESVYLGKPDSLNIYSGLERVKLTWVNNSDPDISETVIYWNMRNDSIVKPFERISSAKQKDSIIIDNLPEGDYNFELKNRNNKGQASLVASVRGSSLGDHYKSGLRPPLVSSIKVNDYNTNTKSAIVELNWINSSGSVGVVIRYNKYTSGELVELNLDPSQTSIILTDVGNRLWNDSDMIYMSSLYAPDQSIDTLASSFSESQIVTYTATVGYRMDVSASGEQGNQTAYGINSPAGNVIDKHFWFSNNDTKTLICDRFGSFGMATDFANFQYFLTLKSDNSFDITGASFTGTPPTLSYSISNTEIESNFDPETGTIYINNMRVLATTGALTYFEEELIPK